MIGLCRFQAMLWYKEAALLTLSIFHSCTLLCHHAVALRLEVKQQARTTADLNDSPNSPVIFVNTGGVKTSPSQRGLQRAKEQVMLYINSLFRATAVLSHCTAQMEESTIN